jgi:mono/diheme cytochrome c family protein
MELVASEPDLIMPAAVEWDGNGRMFVVELRSYMLDADGTDRMKPISRISMWESTKGDGKYDKHTVFVDNLVLPRMVLPLDGNSILTNETDTHDVVKWTDTNGDGVADKRELFYTGVGRPGQNLEHQQSGFIWGMDNWIYSTYNAFRFRWTPNGILREPTGANGGQWGLSIDDDGKMWFVDAGSERGPMNFQVPIHYGAFTVPGQFEDGFDVVWPAPGIGDFQGGMLRVRQPAQNLNHFTATTGPEIVRGHRLPDDMKGDLLFTEPVGRLIRRAKIVKEEGLTQLRNVYPGSEFIFATDLLFRPVNIKTAPDGTLFILDMYQGIIQESNWTPRGSYLRAKIEQYQMENIDSYGRIWRLRYDGAPGGGPNTPPTTGIEPDYTQPRMLNETPAELVRHLSHPNGWWRQTAQRLLVLKQDKSVAPELRTIVRSSDNLLARFHALWTLEGLGELDAPLVREQMEDPNPRMRIQAIRASETLYKAGDKSLETNYRAAMSDPDVDVALQGMLTLNVLKVPGAIGAIRPMVENAKARAIKEIGSQLIARAAPSFAAGRGGRGGPSFAPAEVESLTRGMGIYNELCFACHGEDGRGAPLAGAPPGTTRAPSLEGSSRVTGHRDYVIKVLLHGLTGPIDGQTYTEVMIPMGTNPDQWVADVASFVRNSFSNSAPVVTPADVTRARAATASRKTSWTHTELMATVPTLMEPQPTWKATASHAPDNAARALTGQQQGWNSGAPQQPGMWLQIELPAAVQIAEVQLEAGVPGFGRGGRGGGGRGQGAGAAAPPAPGFPRGYQLQISMDGNRWTTVAQGQGTSAATVIPIQPTRGRFVRVTQTADAGAEAPAWSIQRIRVYQMPTR